MWLKVWSLAQNNLEGAGGIHCISHCIYRHQVLPGGQSMNPGCENLLCYCLFQDVARIGWVWGCFERVFCLFVLSWVSLLLFFVLVLEPSLLTDKYISPLLGKMSLLQGVSKTLGSITPKCCFIFIVLLLLSPGCSALSIPSD